MRRPCPDLYARVLAGELSHQAAMLQAGFRNPPKSRAMTGLNRILKAWRKASPEERAAFLSTVQDTQATPA